VQPRNYWCWSKHLIGLLYLAAMNSAGCNGARLTQTNLRLPSDNTLCRILRSVPCQSSFLLYRPTPVSQSWCREAFPGAFASNDLVTRVAATSDTYLGWKTTADRLFVANGYRDPWLYATHSAPTQNLQSTDLRPIRLSDGFHCSDLNMVNGQYSELVDAVQKEALQTMSKWIASFSSK